MAADESHGIVIFDGTCGFCEGAVVFIARRDPRGYFRFGASQSPEAAALLARHGLSRDTTRSLILIEDGRAYVRSTASLRVAAKLRFPWALARIGLMLPVPVRDAVYRVIAAVRHRLARPSNACEIPPPDLRGRLIGGG